jgi:CBS-domain-containing membrane protein
MRNAAGGPALARARGAVHNPAMLNRSALVTIVGGAAGGAIAIAAMEAFSARTAFPLFAIPFATSIVTVMGSPLAAAAQPRALVGGHLISTIIGLLIVQLCGPGPWTAAAAVGLAMLAMHVSGTFHPPAGIDPLVVVVTDMSWSFLLAPVGVGVVLLAAFAFVWHNVLGRRLGGAAAWPARWW